jgi:hypothetical protein
MTDRVIEASYTIWRDEVVSRLKSSPLPFTPFERHLKQWFIQNLSPDEAIEEAEKQRRNSLPFKERIKT